MSKIEIIVGSMLGGTEYVAEACEHALTNKFSDISLHLQPNFSDLSKEKVIWLVCTSTHGAGDYPDNIHEFVTDLENYSEDLSTVSFMIIGVGDRNYDTFCFAAKNIEKLMLSKGCNKLTKTLLIDMSQDIDPELVSEQWIYQQIDHLS